MTEKDHTEESLRVIGKEGAFLFAEFQTTNLRQSEYPVHYNQDETMLGGRFLVEAYLHAIGSNKLELVKQKNNLLVDEAIAKRHIWRAFLNFFDVGTSTDQVELLRSSAIGACRTYFDQLGDTTTNENAKLNTTAKIFSSLCRSLSADESHNLA